MSDNFDALRDEIALRRASILDARREHADGELSDAALSELVEREEEAIARCEAQMAASAESLAPSDVAVSPVEPRRHRRRYLYLSLGCFVVAVVIVLVSALAPRQPGTSASGNISQSTKAQIAQLLAQGEVDVATQNDTLALDAFNQVLSLDPNNIEALTQSGWLSFSAGSAQKDVAAVRLGESRLRQAIEKAPRDPDPRLYYAIVAALTPGERTLAIQQFQRFLALAPSKQLLATAAPWLRQLGLAAK